VESTRKLDEFSGTLVLVGAGRMGGAMLERWIALGLPPANIVVIEPQPSDRIRQLAASGIRLNPAKPIEANAVVVAVKPQIAEEVIPRLEPWLRAGTIVVSIMAGRTLGGIERMLPAASLVRAMPNLPAAIGQGITVAIGNARVDADQRNRADRLLRAVGSVEWVDEESLLDPVTAVSGSGPAYVFLLAEALARAGTAAGLPEALAMRLARATIAGSGTLLAHSSGHPAKLRQDVTSPGGTTAAALQVLMRPNGLAPLLEEAVKAATDRSRELAR
jgi:pyrroline-5-carboxylate reductase